MLSGVSSNSEMTPVMKIQDGKLVQESPRALEENAALHPCGLQAPCIRHPEYWSGFHTLYSPQWEETWLFLLVLGGHTWLCSGLTLDFVLQAQSC